MRPPRMGDVADLVRLPSVLTVPGDVLLGAATSGSKESPLRLSGLVVSSSCLYMAGMALNDYADRDVDAAERPKRPIPSGRVSPEFALGLATGLTAAGLGLASVAGGRSGFGVALPLAATVWAYDLALKKTRWGPASMASARFLDVLMGAGALNSPRSWPAAGVVWGHIFLITTVSRKEAQGGTKRLALGALAGTAGVVAAAAGVARRRTGGKGIGLAAALGLLGAHAASMIGAESKAVEKPVAENLQRVVGTGVLGLMPLEGGMLAGAGNIGRALALAAGWRIAGRLARGRPVT